MSSDEPVFDEPIEEVVAMERQIEWSGRDGEQGDAS